METFFEILEETPFWIYLIFFFLFYAGIRSLKPRRAPFKQVLILPILLLLWSIISLYNYWNGTWIIPLFWSVFLIFGAVCGWLSIRKAKIGIHKESGTLFLPGSWAPMVLSLALFFIKYGFGVYFAYTPVPPFSLLFINETVSGWITGVFLGYLLFLWRIYVSPGES